MIVQYVALDSTFDCNGNSLIGGHARSTGLLRMLWRVLSKIMRIHRLIYIFLCGACWLIYVIMTFTLIWLALKDDIKVSNYAIVLKPLELC